MNRKALVLLGIGIGTVGLVGGIVLAFLGRGEAIIWIACGVVGYVCARINTTSAVR